MRNYFYLYGTCQASMRVYFVDSKRRATVVASGALWANPAAPWYGVGPRRLLPLLCR